MPQIAVTEFSSQNSIVLLREHSWSQSRAPSHRFADFVVPVAGKLDEINHRIDQHNAFAEDADT